MKKNICITATIYNLLLFLLLVDNSLDETVFIFDKNIYREIKNKIKCYRILGNNRKILFLLQIILNKIRYMYIKYKYFKEREEILYVQDHILNSYFFIKNKKFYLIEDGILTEKEKIELYANILKKEKGNVLIKTHPREKTDYKKYFSCEIINDICPFELYLLEGLEIKRVITLFSTIVYSFEKSEIVFLGTKVHEKLLNFFGNIEYKKSFKREENESIISK